MEENNKKGPSLFYGVVGVATLVVAIIGATFAFFSAQATNDEITGNTAEAGGIVLTVKPVTQTGMNIIPLNLITNQNLKPDSDTEYADPDDQFDDAVGNKCVDSNGNNVCQVYKITITNNSANSAVQVRGTLNLNSSAANMYWKLIDATSEEDGETENPALSLLTAAKVNYSLDVQQGNRGNLTVGGNSNTPVDGDTEAANLRLDGNASKDYYVLVWLEEVGRAQEDEDASKPDNLKTYTGTVVFDAVDALGNTSGLTATFTK